MATSHLLSKMSFAAGPVCMQLCLTVIFIGFFSCTSHEGDDLQTDGAAQSCMKVPSRFRQPAGIKDSTAHNDVRSREGMVLIPGGTFRMGGDNGQAAADEFPKHTVRVDSFYMDVHEVTNAQFKAFVDATGYVTTAERKPDWEELKKMLPPGATKPPESELVAASLVFYPTRGPVDLNHFDAWWQWEKGADWKHPQGRGSSIAGKDHYPVVQVSWDDAMAYCKWSGKRLPTEAEWEFAARGGQTNKIYPWGDENITAGHPKANSWEGDFPYHNEERDAYVRSAPVQSYKPNGYGLYDMAGNVWEWCGDWYDVAYYQTLQDMEVFNPQGPDKSFDPLEPYTPKKVVRGGSFLCNEAYCSGYRVSRRMRTSPDTGLEHTGFRCVVAVR